MSDVHRQDSESVEAQQRLQAELDKKRQENSQLSQSVTEAQAGREQAEEHLERLQGSVRDLQRHNQDRGNYDELQARFKEVLAARTGSHTCTAPVLLLCLAVLGCGKTWAHVAHQSVPEQICHRFSNQHLALQWHLCKITARNGALHSREHP